MSLIIELLAKIGPKLVALDLSRMAWSAEGLRPAMRALASNSNLRTLSLK